MNRKRFCLPALVGVPALWALPDAARRKSPDFPYLKIAELATIKCVRTTTSPPIYNDGN